MKDRSYYLDVIRTLACIMVIVMHSPIPNTKSNNSLILGVISYLTAPCIGLFFMVSGALLLPIKDKTLPFIHKRLSKIIYPTLFWTLFYIICKMLTSNMDEADLLRSILSIPFAAQGNGILWFMYALTGLYLIAPILSSWLEKADKETITLYLVFWFITLCYPFLHLVLSIPDGEENMLFYFSGYGGYFLMGYYLKNYNFTLKRSLNWYLLVVIGLLIILVPPILCKIYHWDIDFYSLFWYLSLGVVVMCIGWFVTLQKLPFIQNRNNVTIIFADISKMSFGIYFIHIFIMRYILWNWDVLQALPYMLQIPLCTILTFGLSYMIIKGMSKLPFSKYIIGC